jgi:hypothetical protein
MHFDTIPTAPDGTAIDLNAPLIYQWEIFNAAGEVVGRYIGKADGGDRRPMQHYRRNVIKLLGGRAYKKGKSYRRVHYGLAAAVQANHRIVLRYLCNVAPSENIFEVESHFIKTLGCLQNDGIGLNGPGPRPYVALSAEAGAVLKSIQPAGIDVAARPSSGDLDYIRRYIEESYPVLQLIAKNMERRLSYFVGEQRSKQRIVRFAQSGPRAQVKVKLVQSFFANRSIREVTWDGTDEHLDTLITGQIETHKRRSVGP